MSDFDASDPMKVAHKSRDAKAFEKRMDNAVRNLMNTAQGREFVYELLSECHIYRNPFATEALVTAFNCGEMNVGQKVLVRLQRVCPDLYSKMIEDENERRTSKSDKPDPDASPDSGGYVN